MNNKFTLNKTEFNGDLADPKIFAEIVFLTDLVKDSESKGDTYKVLQELDHLLKKNTAQLGELKQGYDNLLLDLRLTCFQLLSDDEKEVILKSKMSVAYKNNIDLTRSIALMFIPYFTQDDFVKLNRITRYLEENDELIGTNNITTSDGKTVGPLVSNWIKDYKSKAIEDKGTLNIVSYFTQSPNSKGLTKGQLDFLKYILDFYDWLRFKASNTSLIPEEEPVAPRPSAPLRNVTPNRTTIPAVSSSPVRPPQQAQAKPAAPRALPTEFEKKLAQVSAPPQRLNPAPKPVFQEVKPAAPKPPATEFEKKLAQVSAPSSHGQDLEIIRKQMESSNPPVSGVPRSLTRGEGRIESANLTPEEIKREINTPELPQYKEPVRPVVKPVLPPIVVAPKPVIYKPVAPKAVSAPAQVAPIHKEIASSPPKLTQRTEAPRKDGLTSLDKISIVDDLKKVDLELFRQAPVQKQIADIKYQVSRLAAANKLLPYYTVSAFEQSPLFQAYLRVGLAIIEDSATDRAVAFRNAANKVGSNLTLQEFEAIADLRKEIERL
ncbi:MAG: hypothetical protein ABI643_02025 [Candidatus Doudnabacteria bacterium]